VNLILLDGDHKWHRLSAQVMVFLALLVLLPQLRLIVMVEALRLPGDRLVGMARSMSTTGSNQHRPGVVMRLNVTIKNIIEIFSFGWLRQKHVCPTI
jgi:hypothetical protein